MSLPGDTFTSVATGAPIGIVGTITIEVRNLDTILIAATTAHIVEENPGTYVATLAVPDDAPDGVYRLYWNAGAGDILDDEVLVVAVPVPAEWAPTVAGVAAILRARTRGPESRDASVAGEQGTFTANTRPTFDQVSELIALAVGDLRGLFEGREPCSDSLASSARSAATYRAAQLVEISYFPEQTNQDQTAFTSLQKLWESSSASVAKSVLAHCPVPGGDPDDDGGPLAPAGVIPGRCLIGPQQVRW